MIRSSCLFSCNLKINILKNQSSTKFLLLALQCCSILFEYKNVSIFLDIFKLTFPWLCIPIVNILKAYYIPISLPDVRNTERKKINKNVVALEAYFAKFSNLFSGGLSYIVVRQDLSQNLYRMVKYTQITIKKTKYDNIHGC